MRKGNLKSLSNKELDDLLVKVDFCDRELLKEHDERTRDGRIKFYPVPMDRLEEHIRNKYAYRRKKAS